MTTQTERLMALADAYADAKSAHYQESMLDYNSTALLVKLSEIIDQARATLLAALQEQAQVQARKGEAVAQPLLAKALAALDLAMDNLRPHGDNCFLHDEGEYAGCFCGKDSLLSHLQSVVEELAVAAPQPAQPERINRNDPLSALAIRLLVDSGAVTQETADNAFGAACDALEEEAKRMNQTLPWVVRPAQPEQGERIEVYKAKCMNGKQHDTGRVYTGEGSFFADTASPEDARLIADALNTYQQSAQPVAQPLPLMASQVYTAMNAITRASKGDIDPTFEEMHAALEAAHGIGGAR